MEFRKKQVKICRLPSMLERASIARHRQSMTLTLRVFASHLRIQYHSISNYSLYLMYDHRF